MKIARVWATPVRPPAGYDEPSSWLSESLVANPMSIYPNYLWDVLGKAHGVPVYQLLGGKIQDKLPVYATGNEVA
jgi:L-alanine-DL-glutamate epimerase-like enolase superfamily enzyme